MSDFDSDPFTCDAALFPAKNNLNSAKSNSIFSGKGREDRVLILTYLDNPMAEVFQKGWRKIDEKWNLWVRPFSIKIRIFQLCFKQCFCLLEYYLWRELRQN